MNKNLDGEITMQARREFVLNRLNGGEKLLDVGCASGFISSRSDSYVGLDLNVDNDFNGPNSVVADAHALPFKETSFDRVVMMEVLEHLKSPYHALTEVRRVLKSDGKILVTTPNSSYVYYFMRNLLGRPTHTEYLKFGHIYEFDFRSLKRLFNLVGLNILELHGVFIPLPPRSFSMRNGLGLKLARFLGRNFPLVSTEFFMVLSMAGD